MDAANNQEMSSVEYMKRCEEIIKLSAEDISPEEEKKYLEELRSIIKNQF